MKLRPKPPPEEPLELPIDALSRSDILAFAEKSFYTEYPGSVFEPNWHHEHIAYMLMKSMTDPDYSRLLFNLPPRSMKSELINAIYSAWLLGHDPSCKIISVSYGENLVITMSRMARKIMLSPWYQRIFPHTRLARDKRSETMLETTKGGRRYATTMRGETIGHGADYLIIDDPNPSGPDFTENVAAQAVAIYRDKLITRLNKQGTGVVIVLMQRVGTQDLSSFLLTSGLYKHSKLPLVAEADEDIPIGPNQFYRRKKGEVLHSARLGPSGLEKIRAQYLPAEFQLMWQQNASSSGLNAINLDHFRQYEKIRSWHSYEKVLQVWDCASTVTKDASFSVCMTLGFRNGRFHVIDVYREKVEYPDLLRAAKNLIRLYKPTHVIVEREDMGKGLLADLVEAFGYRGFDGVRPKGLSKEARVDSVIRRYSRGEIVLPKEAPFLTALKEEIRCFPGYYTDQVDCLTYALRCLDGHVLKRHPIDYPDRFEVPSGFRGFRNAPLLDALREAAVGPMKPPSVCTMDTMARYLRRRIAAVEAEYPDPSERSQRDKEWGAEWRRLRIAAFNVLLKPTHLDSSVQFLSTLNALRDDPPPPDPEIEWVPHEEYTDSWCCMFDELLEVFNHAKW